MLIAWTAHVATGASSGYSKLVGLGETKKKQTF